MEFLRLAKTFRKSPLRDAIVDSIDFAFKQNSPELRVLSYLRKRRDLELTGDIRVIGFGKAGRGMYQGTKEFFGDRISDARIILPYKDGDKLLPPFLPGNHPLPSMESTGSSRLLVDSLANLRKDDLVVVLISGGGSSLLELTRDGVDLDEYNETIRCMMKSGANIAELNAVRFLYSRTKGGGLLQFTSPARVLGLIISDVPGDSVGTVASGPTAAHPKLSLIDQSIEKYGKRCNINQFIPRLERSLYKADNHIVLKNSDFVRSILYRLEVRGFKGINLGSGIQGDTKYVAKFLVDRMRSAYREEGVPMFVVGGGETSTIFKGEGIGGRNLELTLRVLLQMKMREEFVFGSIGTDGMDGTSNAMGAIVDGGSLRVLGRKVISDRLSKSESLAPLELTKDVLFTGFTGTNVADVFVGYYAGSNGTGTSDQPF